MVSNERKQLICEKYEEVLKIIDIIGDKMMLQKQFIEISIALGAVKDKFQAIKEIQELERAEIIKKIKFSGTSNKFILFKKYAIRYLAKANKSSQVAGISVVNSNKRYIQNIMKVQFILTTIIPTAKKNNIELTLDNLLVFIGQLNCNILYKDNCMYSFYKGLLNKTNLYFDKKEIEEDFKLLKNEHNKRLSNLKGISKKSEEKYRKNKEDYLFNSNIATLSRKNIYLANIKYNKKSDTTKIIAYYFNMFTNKNSYTIALNYSILYNTTKRLFGNNINIEFRVVCLNELIQHRIIQDLNKKGINPRTKEKRIDTYLIEMLRANRLSEVDFERMNIKILTYNIDI
ncbi:hypothetical protein [Terrisporobacter mayombei]|uniref:Initiator Rep protein domain-containing protein n=1 Tax=Terrisporobacter mayombei TaxID=1541 RepID=A0ABY9Q5M4_9FIRM|nr:hypothetical protein [Terrisporobacter mayombei]MCC3870025.1 hypothetical protein [Terrisporobacter mayombei]WMT82481.1 hypothetical protein TEMA_28960 [Terrisporobacter mayombei]